MKLFNHIEQEETERKKLFSKIVPEAEMGEIIDTPTSPKRLFSSVEKPNPMVALKTQNEFPKSEDSLKNVISASKNEFCMGSFSYQNGELIYRDEKMQKTVVIGNFWIEIKEEIIRISEICNEQNLTIGKKEDVKWSVAIHCMGKIFESETGVKELLSESKILKITRDRAYLEQEKEGRRLYKKYINLLIINSHYEKKYLFSNTGWINISGKGWVYLTKEGIIGETGNQVSADVPYHFIYNPQRVGTKGIFDEFFGLRQLCNGNGKIANSIFLMHYSIVSVLTTLFQNAGMGVNFIVVLIGSTNSQKTAAGLIFTRLFDRTSAYLPDIRFNSTEAAIVEKMNLYGDAILMVDDFVPYAAKGVASEQRKKSEILIRSYGDREPRKRSKAYAKINDVPEYSPVKGCCLMTGEIFQTESESSDTRVIQLKFERGDVDLELLTFYQENLLNYPTFFYDFIQFVQENAEQIQEIMRKKLKEARTQMCHKILTPRFVDSFAIISAGVWIFYDYAYARGFLDADEAWKYYVEDLKNIEKIIIKNDRESKIKSPATTICLALEWGLQTGMVIRCYFKNMEKQGDFLHIVAEDDVYLYILPETLWQLYKDFCKNIGEEAIYRNGRELHSLMKKEDLLLIKTEGKSKQLRATHKIGNFTSKRFFLIKKKEMKNLLDTYENF